MSSSRDSEILVRLALVTGACLVGSYYTSASDAPVAALPVQTAESSNEVTSRARLSPGAGVDLRPTQERTSQLAQVPQAVEISGGDSTVGIEPHTYEVAHDFSEAAGTNAAPPNRAYADLRAAQLALLPPAPAHIEPFSEAHIRWATAEQTRAYTESTITGKAAAGANATSQVALASSKDAAGRIQKGGESYHRMINEGGLLSVIPPDFFPEAESEEELIQAYRQFKTRGYTSTTVRPGEPHVDGSQ